MSELGVKMIQAMRRAAEENPQRIAEKCVYMNDDGTGNCIVGMGLVELNLIDESWARKRPERYASSYNCYCAESFPELGDDNPLKEVDANELAWIGTVQSVQDGRGDNTGVCKPWEKAVEIADQTHGKVDNV